MTALIASIATAAITALLVLAVVREGRRIRTDIGPDAPLYLDGLDAHLDQYLLAHPDLAAGFARLRAAIRDEQTNTTAEGDQ